MSKPRDWQDQYYDGDDLGAVDEHLFPIDADDELCDDDFEALLLSVLTPEEDADEHGE